MLYEAAAGVSPFQGEAPVETLTRVCTHLQPPVRELEPAVPGPLSELIDAKERSLRRPTGDSATLTTCRSSWP